MRCFSNCHFFAVRIHFYSHSLVHPYILTHPQLRFTGARGQNQTINTLLPDQDVFLINCTLEFLLSLDWVGVEKGDMNGYWCKFEWCSGGALLNWGGALRNPLLAPPFPRAMPALRIYCAQAGSK